MHTIQGKEQWIKVGELPVLIRPLTSPLALAKLLTLSGLPWLSYLQVKVPDWIFQFLIGRFWDSGFDPPVIIDTTEWKTKAPCLGVRFYVPFLVYFTPFPWVSETAPATGSSESPKKPWVKQVVRFLALDLQIWFLGLANGNGHQDQCADWGRHSSHHKTVTSNLELEL